MRSETTREGKMTMSRNESESPPTHRHTSCNQRARRLCKLICASSFVRRRNNSCANHNRLHAPTRVCMCAQRVCYHRGSREKRWRRENELGKEEGGYGGVGAEDQVRREEGQSQSHSETFRLKQCQHIPIIPAHSLSLLFPLSFSPAHSPSSLSAPLHPVPSPFY